MVVLQRGDVAIMPGATIEDGASMIKEAVRVLWETAGILVGVRSCTWVPRSDLTELVIGVRLNSGGELSAEDSDWEPVWCDRDEMGVPDIREIIDKVTEETLGEGSVLACANSEGTEQTTNEGIEGMDEWLMEMNNQKGKIVVEKKNGHEETQKVDTKKVGEKKNGYDETQKVHTISEKERTHALEVAIVRYRRTLAEEAAGLRFGDLQPLVMGLERLAGTDLNRVMVALGVMQRELA